jgi:hypothetical protein
MKESKSLSITDLYNYRSDNMTTDQEEYEEEYHGIPKRHTEGFVDEYIERFLQYSYNNEVFALMTFHLILGRCLSQVLIPKSKGKVLTDGRISLWYLSPSSSGKSVPIDFVKAILNGIDENGWKTADAGFTEDERQNIFSVDDFSDLALVGTIKNEELGEPGQKGIFDMGGVVHWDEAASLLSSKQGYRENAKVFIQKALNSTQSQSNVISRRFKGSVMEIKPTCSILMTSFIPRGLVEDMIETGMLQRMLVLPKEVSLKERLRNLMIDVDGLGEEAEEGELDNQHFIDKFKYIMAKYNNPDIRFDFSEAKAAIRGKVLTLGNVIKDSPPTVQKIMGTFLNRYAEHMYILAMHHCCLRDDGKNTISVDDVEHAYIIVSYCFAGLNSWMQEEPTLVENTKKTNQYFADVKKIFTANNLTEISRPDLLKALHKKWGVGDGASQIRINPFLESAEQGYQGLVKFKKGRGVYYSIQEEIQETKL